MSDTTTGSKFWLLRIVLPGKWGRWLTGALIAGSLLIIFLLFGGLFDDDSLDGVGGGVADGVAIFFCVILGYIVPIHHLIMDRSLTAIDQLGVAAGLSEKHRLECRDRVRHKSMRWHLSILSLGLLAGIAHNALLLSASELNLEISSESLLPLLATMAVWVVMVTVISSLVTNAMLFRRIAQWVSIDLLNLRALTPFGSVAVSSTLALIGAQAAYPILALESGVEYVTILPGTIPTVVTMIVIFVLPIWPVHRRIVAAKRTELARLTGEIIQFSRPDGSSVEAYASLNPILIYRQEISTAPDWPFDTSVVSRLAIYLIIPPLTWVGAALIEILIGSAI